MTVCLKVGQLLKGSLLSIGMSTLASGSTSLRTPRDWIFDDEKAARRPCLSFPVARHIDQLPGRKPLFGEVHVFVLIVQHIPTVMVEFGSITTPSCPR